MKLLLRGGEAAFFVFVNQVQVAQADFIFYFCSVNIFKVNYMSAILLFMGFGMQEILVIALIFLLLFGGKKIPELMKGLGKGVKSFKDGVNGVEDDLKADAKKDDSSQSKEK